VVAPTKAVKACQMPTDGMQPATREASGLVMSSSMVDVVSESSNVPLQKVCAPNNERKGSVSVGLEAATEGV